MTRSRCGLRPSAASKWSFVLAIGATIAAHGNESVAPFVPTVEEDVALMLEVGGVGPGDYLIDLGSGDGRIVIEAAKRGAMGHGVELEPELVELAAGKAREAGVADRVAFVQGSVFNAGIGAATVVTTYLFPEAMLELRPKLLAELRPGTRILSNSFHMGEWAPDAHDMSSRSSGGILLWVVPARVEGNWDVEVDGDDTRFSLAAMQRFQKLELEHVGSSSPLSISAAELRGERIAFAAESADARYAFGGRVDGNAMHGFVQVDRDGETRVGTWRARRAAPLPPLR